MELNEALRVIVEDESLSDFIYTVRERAGQDETFDGNSWDHPRVVRFSEAVERLKQELKEDKYGMRFTEIVDLRMLLIDVFDHVERDERLDPLDTWRANYEARAKRWGTKEDVV